MKLSSILSLSLLFLILACAENPSTETISLPLIPENLSPEQQKYAKKGLAAQEDATKSLFAQLETALENGPENALKVCNVAASPTMVRLSKKHKAGIRRASNQNRNATNNPTELEKKILLAYQEQHDKGEPMQARIELFDDQVAYYAPIIVKDKCLKCHGKIGESLDEEFYKSIKKLYPNDKANGYETGDLRGIWSIAFPRESMK